MTITVNGPNGVTINFPEGTDADTINRVMREAVGGKPAEPQASPSLAASAVEGAAQGLTFGFADELEGAVRAGIGKLTGDTKSFGELYDEGVAVPRERLKAHKKSNPLTFGAGELAGGVALPLGAARLGVRGALSAASGRGLGARTVAGAKEGAVYGGLYGAGTAEGGVGDRVSGAASGALTGAAIGAAAPGAIDAASAVGTRIAAPFRAVRNPQQFAAEKVGEAIARDNPVGGAERFANRFEDMANLSPSARLMDAGGDNVRGVMRAANNVPNEARETARRTIDARQGNQWSRLEGGLVDSIGGERSANYYSGLERLAQRLDDQGREVIQPALRIETPMTPRLRSVLDRPTMQELRQSVERKLADEGAPIGFETRTQMLHRMKMELDEQIGASRRAEQMGNRPQAGWDTRTLTILKRDLLNAIDNPQYKEGLRGYANVAQLRNATEDGYEAFSKQQPEQIRAALRDLDNDIQRDFYRFGALRAVVEKIRKGNSNRDRTDGLFSSPEMQMKLRAIFPTQQQFRNFQRLLVTEAKMADSRKALQGNSTTARQLAEGGEAGKTASMITQAMNAAGGSFSSAMNLLAQGYNRFTGMTPRVAGEVLNLGMSRDPAAVNALVRRGVERAAQSPGRRAAATQRAVAGGAALGTGPLEVTVYPAGDPRNYR